MEYKTMESEYKGASQRVKTGIWISNGMVELHLKDEKGAGSNSN